MALQVERESEYLRQLVEEERYVNKAQEYKDLLTGAYKTAQQQYQASTQSAAQQASYDISGAYANYLKQQRAVVAQGQLESGYKQEVSDVLQSQFGSAYQQARAMQAESVASAFETYGKTTESAYSEYLKNIASLEESATKEAKYMANIQKAADEYVQLNLSKFTDAQKSLASGEGFKLYTTIDNVEDLTDYGRGVYTKALLSEDRGFEEYLQSQGLSQELEYYLSNPAKIREDLFGITLTGTVRPEQQEEITSDILSTPDYIESVPKSSLDLSWKSGSSATEIITNSVTNLYDTYMPNIGVDVVTTKTVKDAVSKYIDTLPVKRGSQGLPQIKINKTIQEITNGLSGETITPQQLSTYLQSLFDKSEITNVHVQEIFNYIVSEIEAQSKQKYRGE